MCLLVFMEPNATVPSEDLEVAAVANPDGFGWAIIGDDTIHTHRSMSFNEALSTFEQQRKLMPDRYALFHLRIATHGTTSLDNCHPFHVGGDHRTVLAHNGMLDIKGDHRSDSRIFAEEWLPTLGAAEWLDDPQRFAELERFARGSKLVVLSVDPLLRNYAYILNESSGHWGEEKHGRRGVWYSNYSYEWMPRRSYVSYGSYGGWQSEWTYDPESKQYLRRELTPAPQSVELKRLNDLPSQWITPSGDAQFFGLDEYAELTDEGYTVFLCSTCDSEFAVDTFYDEPVCPDCLTCASCKSDICMCNEQDEFDAGQPIPLVGKAVSPTAYLGDDGEPYVWDDVRADWVAADVSDFAMFRDHLSLTDWFDLFPNHPLHPLAGGDVVGAHTNKEF